MSGSSYFTFMYQALKFAKLISTHKLMLVKYLDLAYVNSSLAHNKSILKDLPLYFYLDYLQDCNI